MKIDLATGSDDEQRAAAVLESLLVEYAPAVDRFLYTDTVLVDAAAESPYSHPVLTITPSHLLGPRLVALRVLVHENMHWASNELPGCRGIIDEARQRWPHPPAPADGGARNAFSTWLHVSVCALELEAMCALVGETVARSTIASVRGYRWIYAQLLGDELPFRDLLARHKVELPPVPPTRLVTIDALRSATNSRDHTVPALLYPVEMPLWRWALATDGDALAEALGSELDPWRDTGLEPARLAAIVAVTAITFTALTRLGGRDTAVAAGATHYRNAEIYEAMGAGPRADAILDRIATASSDAGDLVTWARHG